MRGEQSPELLDRRMECLDQGLREIDALLDVLGRADAPLIETRDRCGAAPRPPRRLRRAATRTRAMRRPSAAERERVSTVRDLLARASAELDARHGETAVAIAEQAWSDAASLEHPATRIDARLVLARARGAAGDAASAEADLRAVIERGGQRRAGHARGQCVDPPRAAARR